MRFYLQHKQDPHGPNIALFIGNLPQALSQRNYETIITKYITEENKYSSIGPIYYEYGSVIITFENASKAVSSPLSNYIYSLLRAGGADSTVTLNESFCVYLFESTLNSSHVTMESQPKA